jgi:Zn ribbon nucleic-acid-binding protein
MANVKDNVQNSKGILIHCPNSECNYAWRYSGRFILYATCPSCKRNVKILENKIESLQSVTVGRQGQIAAVRTTPVSKELMQDYE